jgi:2-phospho-L-lactate guanylyltransferase
MSGIHAVVPVKALAAAKQRLAGVLSASARRDLALAMVEDVMAVLAAARGLAGIVVVTEDRDAAAVVARFGARVLAENATDGQTAAVTAAARVLARDGEGMLAIPADLPLIEPDDVHRVLQCAATHRFAIVPAHDGRGSNAVLCLPADIVALRFGGESCAAHLAAARAGGIEPVTLDLPRIALDIDEPADLDRFLAIPSRTHARAALARHGLGA